MKLLITSLILLFTVLFLTNCKSIPKGAKGVSPFELEKYLGTWYEIARIDFKFEKYLNNTTASYSMKDNGMVKVLNRGFNTKKLVWKEAEGKAKFTGESTVAELKVSFFGPFYAGYNVIALEGNYEYALVAGRNTDYLWILSRKTSIPDDIKMKFLKEAENIGYDTSRLMWIDHNKASKE